MSGENYKNIDTREPFNPLKIHSARVSEKEEPKNELDFLSILEDADNITNESYELLMGKILNKKEKEQNG